MWRTAFVLGSVLLCTVGGGIGGAGAADLVVDDDGVECPGAYLTIQAAVDAAALLAGPDTIRICPGTYPENVSIGPGNRVNLLGDGSGVVFVTGIAATAGPIIDADRAGTVVISGLTVDGGSAMVCSVSWGIRYRQTSGKIRSVTVRNIRDALGNCQGLGIRVESTGPTANVLVERSLIQNATRVGIIGNGRGVTLIARDNLILGPAAPKVWAPNGIQVSRGARGTLQRNEVRDMTSPSPPDGTGSGIILFCAGRASVYNNEVFASDVGVALADNADSQVKGNVVRDSLFDAITLEYLGTYYGNLGCPQYPSPTRRNVIQSNQALDSAGNGISLSSVDPALPIAPTDNTIKSNVIARSGANGIAVFDGAEGNRFAANRISDSDRLGAGGFDAFDETIPTPNTWLANLCTTAGHRENQPGLCR